MKEFLPAQEVKNLKTVHRVEKDRRRVTEKLILLLKNDYPTLQVAEILLLDEITIRRYEQIFKTRRIESPT